MADQPTDTKISESEQTRAVLTRGLLMIVFAFLFGLAETILFFCAVFQFFWMVAKGSPNESIANFGQILAKWLAKVTLFQTGASEDLPFPWRNWD